MPDRYGPAFSSSADPERSSSGELPCCPESATCCSVPSDFEKAHVVRDLIVNQTRAAGFDESACFGIQLALDEALANAIIHGNGRSAEAVVEITYDITPQSVYLSIRDEGKGFDPCVVDDPTREENLAIPAGRGLFLMRAYMTNVHYNKRGNCVTMIHRRAIPSEPTKTDAEGNEKDSA